MRIVFGLALLGASCVLACGSSGGGGGSNNSSAGANSSAGDEGKAGGNGSGGKGSSSGGAGNGEAGDTGEAGGAPVVSSGKPHAAGGLVAGGVVAHSKNFTGVFSLGAAPGGNGVSTSANSQLRGGVVGASQK